MKYSNLSKDITWTIMSKFRKTCNKLCIKLLLIFRANIAPLTPLAVLVNSLCMPGFMAHAVFFSLGWSSPSRQSGNANRIYSQHHTWIWPLSCVDKFIPCTPPSTTWYSGDLNPRANVVRLWPNMKSISWSAKSNSSCSPPNMCALASFCSFSCIRRRSSSSCLRRKKPHWKDEKRLQK